MKKFNYKLAIEVFRNSTQKNLGVLRGSFLGFGCPKRHPDQMPRWLRPWEAVVRASKQSVLTP